MTWEIGGASPVIMLRAPNASTRDVWATEILDLPNHEWCDFDESTGNRHSFAGHPIGQLGLNP